MTYTTGLTVFNTAPGEKEDNYSTKIDQMLQEEIEEIKAEHLE